jgi:hypothetical protein
MNSQTDPDRNSCITSGFFASDEPKLTHLRMAGAETSPGPPEFCTVELRRPGLSG